MQNSLTLAELMPIVYWLVAFICGCIAATAELFSRYSDGPGRIFQFKESYIYLLLNGVVSTIAYAIIKKMEISFGLFDKSNIGQAVFSGFSAMAVLRSSFASLKSGEKTVQVGLAPIMQVFLDTVDRAFDRNRAELELNEVSAIMKNVDFSKAAMDLPQTCLNLMQNVSKEETEKLGREVSDINKTVTNNQVKSFNLGFVISRVTGPKFLKAAVDSLGDSIRYSAMDQHDSKQQPSESQEDRIKELKKKLVNL